MVGQNNGQAFHMATIPTFEETIANLPYDAMQRTVTNPSGRKTLLIRTHVVAPPHPGLYGVRPVQDWMGYRTPPCQEIEQHSEHLPRGGRHASCVHAGGLSCLLICCNSQLHKTVFDYFGMLKLPTKKVLVLKFFLMLPGKFRC